MSDDNPATDPEVPPPPDPTAAPTQPANQQMPEPEPIQIEEQKPESWISKHQQELEDFLNEREKKTGPARPGKKDSIDDEPEPEPAPAPAPKRKRFKLRSSKRSA